MQGFAHVLRPVGLTFVSSRYNTLSVRLRCVLVRLRSRVLVCIVTGGFKPRSVDNRSEEVEK